MKEVVCDACSVSQQSRTAAQAREGAVARRARRRPRRSRASRPSDRIAASRRGRCSSPTRSWPSPAKAASTRGRSSSPISTNVTSPHSPGSDQTATTLGCGSSLWRSTHVRAARQQTHVRVRSSGDAHRGQERAAAGGRLEAGADVNLKSGGRTALHGARPCGRRRRARYLIARGATLTANVAARLGWFDELQTAGRRPTRRWCTLAAATASSRCTRRGLSRSRTTS